KESFAELAADAEVQVNGVRRLQVVINAVGNGKRSGAARRVCHRQSTPGRGRHQLAGHCVECGEARRRCRAQRVGRIAERTGQAELRIAERLRQWLSDEVVVHSTADSNRRLARTAEEELRKSAV